MYFKEVHQLWAFQANFHYQLTDELREQFIGHPEDIDPGGVLFFQRPLKSQKHRVGNCAFETNKTPLLCIFFAVSGIRSLEMGQQHSLQ